MAEAVLQTLGQQIIVDNRGASINIGAQAVSTAKPDGNTFMSADNAILAYNEHLFTKLPFNPEKNFTDVGGISRFPLAGVEPRVRSQDGEGVSGLRTRQPRQAQQRIARQWLATPGDGDVQAPRKNLPHAHPLPGRRARAVLAQPALSASLYCGHCRAAGHSQIFANGGM